MLWNQIHTNLVRYPRQPLSHAMLKLTKRTEYGLIALMHLADRTGEVLSVRSIGERYSMPQRLLAQTLQDLSHSGLVQSQRGAGGGYSLAQAPNAITLGAVVQALEGQPGLTSCHEPPALGQTSVCGIESLCPIRSPLDRIRHGIWELLQGTTLQSLADSSLSPRELFTVPSTSPSGTATS